MKNYLLSYQRTLLHHFTQLHHLIDDTRIQIRLPPAYATSAAPVAGWPVCLIRANTLSDGRGCWFGRRYNRGYSSWFVGRCDGGWRRRRRKAVWKAVATDDRVPGGLCQNSERVREFTNMIVLS